MSLPSALIGYTGFVGSNLAALHQFDELYNSKNISEIKSKHFDTVVCAAAPGVKWFANKNPEIDRASIELLINNLTHITTNKFILISTVDVYNSTVAVTEKTNINTTLLQPYGQHRRMLEEFVQNSFNHLVVRLTGIYGPFIKKNPIFDLLHNSYDFINGNNQMQFYFLRHLWDDIQKSLENKLSLINFAPEPVTLAEIGQKVFHVDLSSTHNIPPATYAVQTSHSALWNQSIPYLYTKANVLDDLQRFVEEYKKTP